MGYNSNLVTVVVMIFAFLAGTNFILMYKFFVKGKILAPIKSEEFITYLIITLLIGFLIALSLHKNMGFTFSNAIITGLFQTISIMMSAGFASSDFGNCFDSCSYHGI